MSTNLLVNTDTVIVNTKNVAQSIEGSPNALKWLLIDLMYRVHSSTMENQDVWDEAIRCMNDDQCKMFKEKIRVLLLRDNENHD